MAGYVKQRASWADDSGGGTPVMAAQMNGLEQAIYDLKHDAPNVKADYGAVGNGSTDDTSAITSMITDLTAGASALGVFPPGTYRTTSTITIPSGAAVILDAHATQNGGVVIRRDFNGSLFDIYGSVIMRNLFLYDSSTSAARSGAALNFRTTSSTRPGLCLFDGLRISSTDTAGAWERIIDADGTLYTVDALGCRDIHFRNCAFFGSRTAGETFRINRGTGWHWQNSYIAQAPTAINQGIKLLDAVNSDGFHFMDFAMAGGDLYSEVANVNWYSGLLNGGVNLTVNSRNSVLMPSNIIGTITDAGTSNTVFELGRFHSLVQNIQATGRGAFATRVTGDANYRLLVRSDGQIIWGDGTNLDATISRDAYGNLRVQSTKLIADSGLGVGYSVAATTLGSIVKKIEVFGTNNASLGFIPVCSPNATVSAKTANYTATAVDEVILVNSTSGNVTITLPSPVSGARLVVKRTDASANTVTLSAPGGATIDGSATQSIVAQYDDLDVVSDGTNWYIIV